MTHNVEIDANDPRVRDLLERAWEAGYKAGYSYRGPLGEGAGNPVPDNPFDIGDKR